MNKKEIQKSRMWQYFVEATASIIEEEGIEKVTIRKVGDRAGYNSATIYNYFSELSHLLFFASMRFLKPYTDEVTLNIKKGNNPIEKWLISWECFCKHSYHNPTIFHAIFIADLGDQPDKFLEHYYSIYPNDLINMPEYLKPILFERNISKRGRDFLELAVKEGMIAEENADGLNELTLLIWKGMFTNILNRRTNYTPDEAVAKTMKYISEVVLNQKYLNLKNGKA